MAKPRFPVPEERIVELVQARFKSASGGSNFTKFASDYKKLFKAYRQEFTNSKKVPVWQSRLYMSTIYTIVRTYAAFFKDALFSTYPIFNVVPSGVGDKASGLNLQAVMMYDMYKMQFEYKMLDVILNTLLYGYSPVRPYWEFQEGIISNRVFERDEDGLISSDIEETFGTIKDHSSFKQLHPLDLMWDPDGDDKDTSLYEIEIEKSNLAAILKKVKHQNLFNISELRDRAATGGHTQNNESYKADEETIDTIGVDDFKKNITLWHYWGPVDVLDSRAPDHNVLDPFKHTRNYHITIADGNLLIGFEPTPYVGRMERPHEYFNIVKEPHKVYGIGAAKPSLPTSDLMNNMINMRIDGANQIINPRMLVNADAFINPQQLKRNQPGQLLFVNNVEDISKATAPIGHSDIGRQTFNDVFEFLNRHKAETSAANDFNIGASPKSARTATEINQVTGGANMRFTNDVFTFTQTGFQPLLRSIAILAQQFMDQTRIFRIRDSKHQFNIDPRNIQGEYDFELHDSTVSNKDVQSQLYINLLGVMAPYVQALGPEASGSIRTILRGFLDNMPLIKDADQILPQEVPANEAQILAQQGANASANGITPSSNPAALAASASPTPNIPGAPSQINQEPAIV